MFKIGKNGPNTSSDAATYLSYDQQYELSIDMEKLANREPLFPRVIFPDGAYLGCVSLYPLSFFTWRAGFRGYGLSKYGRGRLLTVLMAVVYPTYGGYAHTVFSTPKLLDPYRVENQWYHGVRHAIFNQIGTFITISGNICLAFLVANRSGLLPIPDGMHKPGVREVATQILLARVKPYSKSIAISAMLSTAFMFAVGVGAYQQSCSILAKLNRKSLIYKED